MLQFISKILNKIFVPYNSSRNGQKENNASKETLLNKGWLKRCESTKSGWLIKINEFY